MTVPTDDEPATVSDSRARDAGDSFDLVILLFATVKKQVLLLLRYPVNTAAEMMTVYLFFVIFFFGGQEAASAAGVGAGALGGTFEGLIVGWFLWTMSQLLYWRLAATVTRESQWGTLEQLYLSPFGFGQVMAAKVIAYLLESLVWGGIILVLMLATTGRTLAVDLLTIVPISLLSVLSVVGIGFMFGGLALVYKRVGNVQQLMQFVLLGLVGAPAAGMDPLRLLPLVQGSAMLQRAMRNGIRLWEFPAADLGVLIAAGTVYPLVGFLVFRYCTGVARKRGVMGHY